MIRHFGINSGRLMMGRHQPSASRADTPREPYKLPSQSLYRDPLADAERTARAADRLAIIIFSVLFFLPLVGVGIILRFH